MIIDSVDISDLGDNPELAFVTFEQRLRSALELAKQQDARTFYDNDGNYHGTYAPQRYYVSSILAFLDEYDVDVNVDDITEVSHQDFPFLFDNFFNKINYAKTRFALRSMRVESGAAGTPIEIKSDFKMEISKNLDVIRKIVNQQVSDVNKRDAIFKRISQLQLEIDRDRTTLDIVFGRLVDLSKTLGECAENLEPAITKLERISAALTTGTIRVKLLVSKERVKQISAPTKKASELLDDEIPF